MLHSAIGHSTQGRSVTHQLPGTDRLLHLCRHNPIGPSQSNEPFTGQASVRNSRIMLEPQAQPFDREPLFLAFSCFSPLLTIGSAATEKVTWNKDMMRDPNSPCDNARGLFVSVPRLFTLRRWGLTPLHPLRAPTQPAVLRPGCVCHEDPTCMTRVQLTWHRQPGTPCQLPGHRRSPPSGARPRRPCVGVPWRWQLVLQ